MLSLFSYKLLLPPFQNRRYQIPSPHLSHNNVAGSLNLSPLLFFIHQGVTNVKHEMYYKTTEMIEQSSL